MIDRSGVVAADRDRAHLDRLEDVPIRPIFIMGNARAGTTILYQVLTKTGSFNYVSAYHLIRYHEILDNELRGTTEEAKRELSELFQSLGVSEARFDGVGVDPDFPEEYGFHLGQFRFQLTRKTLPMFLELCRKVQLVSGNDKPILLKNPWDYRRFLFIKEVLPQSKFVFIHREPVDVTSSLLRAMRTLLKERNEYHALMAGSYRRMMESGWKRRLLGRVFGSTLGAKIVARQFATTAHYFVENVSKLPSSATSRSATRICVRARARSWVTCSPFSASSSKSLSTTRLSSESLARRSKTRASVASVRELRRLDLDLYADRCGYQWRT